MPRFRTHAAESWEKRQKRPIFIATDGRIIRGLLPQEIAEFYARVNRARERALARKPFKYIPPRAVAQPVNAPAPAGAVAQPRIARERTEKASPTCSTVRV